MKHPYTVLLRTVALFAVLAFCCGFSWGLGKSDTCQEARTTLNTLSTVTDPVKRTKLEESILKSCPNGGVGVFIKALQAERASKQDAAISLYREALEKDGTIAEAHGNLGLILHDRGLDEEASVELTQGLMGHPDPRYHLAMAQILCGGTNPSLAVFHFSEALKAYADDASIHEGLAKAYLQLGQYKKAGEEFLKLKRLRPKEVRFQLGLADTWRKAGRLDRAIEELRAYIGANPSDKQGHRLLAEVLMENGDRETARREYLLAGVDVTIDPEDFARKGDQYMKAREYGQAIGAYQTALKGRPAWTEIQYNLGKAQMAAGRDDDAMVTFTALIKSGSKDGALFHDVGLLYERIGQLDQAIDAYRLAIANEPDNVNAHRRLAEIFTWRGSFTEAAQQYRELIRLRGDNPLYHLNLARVYDRSKDQKRAASEYETAVKLDPDNLEGHRELARIYLLRAQTAKSEHHYREVLRLNNEDEAARNALITMYVKQKRYDDLTTFVKEWLDKAPDDPQRHYRLGIVYEFKKEYNLAVSEYKKAIELQPDNARMLFALGRTYMKTGLLSESREMLAAAKKADPTLAGPQLLLSSLDNSSQPSKKQLRNSGKTSSEKQIVRNKKNRAAKKAVVRKKSSKKH